MVEAAALAHDIGHPPFSYNGAFALERGLVEKGIAGGFNGNAQTFRLLTNLASFDESTGLNLSRACLGATLKYPWFRQVGSHFAKWGVYESEAADFTWVRAGNHAANEHLTIEAEIVEWADDVAYAVHDVEDFFEVGLIPIDRIARGSDETDHFIDNLKASLEQQDWYEGRTDTELRAALITFATKWSFTEPYATTDQGESLLRRTAARLQSEYADSLSFSSAVDATSLIRVDPRALFEVHVLKELTQVYVLKNSHIANLHREQGILVGQLFDFFVDASATRSTWEVFPTAFRARLDSAVTEHNRLRTVSDFVASLSEDQAIQLHKTWCPGSLVLSEPR